MHVLVEHEGLLSLRKARLAWQALALLRAGHLDGQLARGEPPMSRPVLAVRAVRLTSSCYRHAVGRNLLCLAPPGPAVDDVATALLGDEPVPARTVAIVSELIADGTGPLYRRAGADEVHAICRQAGAALRDPLMRCLG